jgi:hypothetical protein
MRPATENAQMMLDTCPVQAASRWAILLGRERLTRGREPLLLVKSISSDRDLARTTAAIDA